MATHEETSTFRREFARLTDEQKAAFRTAVRHMIEDLPPNRPVPQYRKGLRVKGVRGQDRVFEMTWADDGRAHFGYGTPPKKGHTHVIWLSIGSHDIFKS